MFQFPGLPPPSLCVQLGVAGYEACWVRPFGDPRVKGHVRLTVAYRSLSRPSSASCAKASTVCPYHLPKDGSVHTYTWRLAPPIAIRCDLLEKENIVLVTLCSSQGTAGTSPGDRTLRAPPGARRRGLRDSAGTARRARFKFVSS